jgi:iron-sulfur cluster repair protein YtfE (RIC family)
MEKHELVAKLKEQHQSLRYDLDEMARLAAAPSEGANKEIFSDLERFKMDLFSHLKLEDGVFYPDYLSKLVQKGIDVGGVEEFIRQMAAIAGTVMAFFEKYATPESISASYADFGQELRTVADTLTARIETEEEGVYDIYLSM